MTSNDFNNAEIAELIFQEDTNLTNCSTEELLTKKEQLGRISRMAKVASENIDRCLDRTYGQRLQSELAIKEKDDGSHTFTIEDGSKLTAKLGSSISYDDEQIWKAYDCLCKSYPPKQIRKIFKLSVPASQFNALEPTAQEVLKKSRTKKISEKITYTYKGA
tara:strand:- start:833 stop:1318 length:486 start_codon:yes stop_codon:yes gene_type:complete